MKKYHDCYYVRYKTTRTKCTAYCKNEKSGRKVCNCDGIIIRNECPYFLEDKDTALTPMIVTEDIQKKILKYRSKLIQEAENLNRKVDKYLDKMKCIILKLKEPFDIQKGKSSCQKK